VLEFLTTAIKQEKRGDSNREGRTQIILVCREYHPILERLQRLHQKTLRSGKHF
jgi:hypothetical protein